MFLQLQEDLYHGRVNIRKQLLYQQSKPNTQCFHKLQYKLSGYQNSLIRLVYYSKNLQSLILTTTVQYQIVSITRTIYAPSTSILGTTSSRIVQLEAKLLFITLHYQKTWLTSSPNPSQETLCKSSLHTLNQDRVQQRVPIQGKYCSRMSIFGHNTTMISNFHINTLVIYYIE